MSAVEEPKSSSSEACPADADSSQEVVAKEIVESGSTKPLCDSFLDRYASMMDHENIACILTEQEHM